MQISILPETSSIHRKCESDLDICQKAMMDYSIGKGNMMQNIKENQTAVCTFLGHRTVFDRDIHQRLSKAVYKLVDQHDTVEFLFCNQGSFYDSCLIAVLSAKQQFPKKKITLSLVLSEKEKVSLLTQRKRGDLDIPIYLIDRIIVPQDIPPPTRRYYPGTWKKIERWALKQSTHLISYVYFSLLDENLLERHQYAERIGLNILPVAAKETQGFIEDKCRTFTEQEQIILRKKLSGEKKTEIEAYFCMKPHTLTNILGRISSTLQRSILAKLHKLRLEEPPPPVICSIFSMGEITYESMLLLEQAALFLVKRCHVTQFQIASEYCHSGYMYILREVSKRYTNVKIIAVAPTQDWAEHGVNHFSLPCHDVKVLGLQYKTPGTLSFQMAKAMIGQSDFCICDLSTDIPANRIKGQFEKVNRVNVLDISKEYTWNEESNVLIL